MNSQALSLTQDRPHHHVIAREKVSHWIFRGKMSSEKRCFRYVVRTERNDDRATVIFFSYLISEFDIFNIIHYGEPQGHIVLFESTSLIRVKTGK